MQFREIPGRVKEHVKEHKELYIGIGIGAGLAGITCTIVRAKHCPMWEWMKELPNEGAANIGSFSFKNQGVINVTTVLDREGRGHPGWPVRNLETRRVFFSQREAANAFDISEGTLSSHLNGKFEDANGLHFERVSLPVAA